MSDRVLNDLDSARLVSARRVWGHGLSVARVAARGGMVFAVSVAFAATGCRSAEQRGNEKACTAALADGRLRVKDADIDAARGKLAEAEQACPGWRAEYVQHLRDEIAASVRKAEADRERDEQRRADDLQRPAVPLLAWVSERYAAADKSSAGATCPMEGEALFGWCTVSEPLLDGVAVSSQFWRRDHLAVRYSIQLPGPILLDDLGNHSVVRTWTPGARDGVSRLTYCELLDKRHRGLYALVTNGTSGVTLDVFTREYLDRDPAFARLLRD